MKKTTIRSGYTLLEMLLVLAVLGVVVMGSFSVSNISYSSRRFDDNQLRLQNLREAVLGSLESQMEDCTLISGFAADIGRLPLNLRELVVQGDLPLWSYDEVADQWSGWRGPYLQSFARQNGATSFSDGWGNFGDTNNFGWLFEVDQNIGTLFVQSLGSDGVAGGDGYDQDYPTSRLLVNPREALIDIAGWSVTVYLHNPEDPGAVALPLENLTIRVRMYFPEDGSLDWPETWPSSSTERDEANYLSMAEVVTASSVSDGGALTLTFEFGDTPKLVPYGVRSLAVVNDADGELAGSDSQEAWRINILSRMRLTPQSMAWNLE